MWYNIDMFNTKNKGKGLIVRGPDPRDVKFKDFIPLGATPIDWNKGFDLRDLFNLRIEDQGSSSSCVSQSWSTYAEILDKIETGKPIHISARGIYSLIFIPPDGGAYLYKGGSILIHRGGVEESITPSYMDGNPPTEEFMRIRNDSDLAIRNAGIRKISGYAVVSSDIEEMARAIQINNGVVFGVIGDNAGWQTAYPLPPTTSTTWGHAILAIGFKIINGKKHIIFQNSWSLGWGDNGFGYLSEDYFKAGRVIDGYTAVDLPNQYLDQINMKRVIQLEGTKDQYLVNGTTKILIPDLPTRDLLIELEIIPVGLPETVTKAVFDSLTLSSKVLPSVKADKINREFYEFYKERLPLLADSYESE